MKIMLVIVSFYFSFFAHAESPLCQINAVKVFLNPNSISSCQSLKIEGQYKIKLCDNGRGVLVSSDGTERYLFKSDNSWFARRDHFDFTNNIFSTETVQINSQISEFLLSKTESSRDGSAVENFKCSGRLEILWGALFRF